MKIIHTADWHIGQDFYHYDRKEEHRFFFVQLEEIVKKEQPDLLLVCGDVYHTATPSNASVRLYTEGMMQMHQACPEMQIVVTAGNHDSSSRLVATAELWKLAKVFVTGGLEWDSETGNPFLERHILEIPHKAFVIAVPYINERYYSIFGELQQLVAERNHNNLPVIMTGHLAIGGSDITGHDPSIIGGMETASLSDFGSQYDYWALGHIHCPQTLNASGGRVRYSGSPLHVSFDENYRHSVTMVTIEKHGDLPVASEIPVKQLVHTKTIPFQALPLDDVLMLLKNDEIKKDILEPAYLRIRVLVKDYLTQQASDLILEEIKRHKFFRFCLIQSEMETSPEGEQPILFDTRQIQDTNPVEVAKACYQYKFGSELEESKVRMLEEIFASVSGNEQ